MRMRLQRRRSTSRPLRSELLLRTARALTGVWGVDVTGTGDTMHDGLSTKKADIGCWERLSPLNSLSVLETH